MEPFIFGVIVAISLAVAGVNITEWQWWVASLLIILSANLLFT